MVVLQTASLQAAADGCAGHAADYYVPLVAGAVETLVRTQIHIEQYETGIDVAVDADNNAVVVGYYRDSTSPSDLDGFVAKVRSNGSVAWRVTVEPGKRAF